MRSASCRASRRVRSPESNGIAEAFVKSFKRDYVQLNARPDAAAVMLEGNVLPPAPTTRTIVGAAQRLTLD